MGASIIRYLKVRDPLPNPLMASLWIWAGHKRVLEWMIKHIKWGLILNLLMSAFLVASLKSSEYFFDVSSFPGPLWIGSEFRHLWIDLRTINYIWYLLTRSLEDKWYLESTYTISEWSEAQLFGLTKAEIESIYRKSQGCFWCWYNRIWLVHTYLKSQTIHIGPSIRY